jgi:serine O-acetyltransferase
VQPVFSAVFYCSAMSSQTEVNEICLWNEIRQRAAERAAAEPVLASFLHATILNHHELSEAVSYHLAGKLASETLPAMQLREIMQEAMSADPGILQSVCADIRAVLERDPAVKCCLVPLLFLKGIHALAAWRVAAWLWRQGRELMAVYLQNRISEKFGVDIHPAARIGRGILMDHATSIVIGETAVIEDDVSLLHEVTLGGTGKATGDRHPKVRRGVLIGAGAKILGNVEIGAGAKVGAGSVVLRDVPPNCTVAGVPAVVVGRPISSAPALDMDHGISTGDAI